MNVQFCVSETDALGKWCPFTRPVFPAVQQDDGVTPGNRPMGNSNWREISGTCCIGSDCMAWRWVETHILTPATQEAPLGDTVLSGDTHGYCGLAGDPRLGVR